MIPLSALPYLKTSSHLLFMPSSILRQNSTEATSSDVQHSKVLNIDIIPRVLKKKEVKAV